MKTFKCIASLEENSVDVFLEVSSILLKLVDNILMYPSNPKYRKLRLENKLVSTVIIPSIGAMECLFEIGFQEGEDSLFLPAESTSIENLSTFRTEISRRRSKYLKDNSSTVDSRSSESAGPAKNERQSTPQPEAASHAQPILTEVSGISSNANPFLIKLHMQSSHVLQYENENVKRKALSVIPLSDINERVQKRMRQLQQQALKDSQPINEASLQEALLFTELMAWFKNDFFQWVNSPPCPKCNCDTQFLEMSSRPEELKLSDRVEVYKCGRCGDRVLFPRLNDVLKLLETRKGRCGEWANVFTALCRALHWDARYVNDETDHVWTEVFFKSEQRWVHCDPCECALDKPLLYEKGWGKQLSYIIAFSCEEVQDVTWRYSANHKAVLSRRRQCTEQQLLLTLKELNKVRQSGLSVLRKKSLTRRTLKELVQLMAPAVEREGDSEGRQSGSLEWRLARCETTIPSSYVWTPTSQEVEAKRMTIGYCTATDEYKRGTSGERIRGWRAGAFAVENMFRKEEKDWKTVYLCRTESSVEGKIAWQFDLSSCGDKVDQVEVRCLSSTFQSGRVLWLLCSGDKCIPVNNGCLKTSELRGSTVVKLSATVSGGEGSTAWQHAQLFRQPLDASEEMFQLTLTLLRP